MTNPEAKKVRTVPSSYQTTHPTRQMTSPVTE